MIHVQEQRDALRRIPLVGMQASLRAIRLLLQAATHQSLAQALVLEGPTGCGKSRLLEEALRMARKAFRFEVCVQLDAAQLAQTTPTSHASERRAREEDSHLVALVEEIPKTYTGPKPEHALRSHIERQLAQVKRRDDAKGAALLLIDNAEYLNQASVHTLEALLRQQSSLAVMLCVRNSAATPLVTALSDRPTAIEVHEVPALAPRHLHTLVHATLNADSTLPELLLAGINTRAQGNPGQALQILGELQREGLISQDAAGRLVVSLEELEHRRDLLDVDAALREQLELLGGYERRSLERAAVVGQHFFAGAVLAQQRQESRMDGHASEILRRGADEAQRLDRVLAQLVDKKVIETVERGVGLSVFRFTQRRLRQLLYEGQEQDLRTRRHRIVAGWAATQAAGALPNAKVLRALHLDRGQRSRDAAQAYLEAAGDGHETRSTRTAISYLERCIALSRPESVEVRVPALILYADTLARLGQCEKATDAATEGLMLAWRFAAHRFAPRAVEVLAGIAWRQGNYDDALRHLEDRIWLARSASRTDAEAEATLTRLFALHKLGLPLDESEETRRICEAGCTSLHVRALWKLWRVRRALSQGTAAELNTPELYSQIELWKHPNHILYRTLATECLVDTYLRRHEVKPAIEALEKLLVSAKELPDRYVEARALLMLTRCALENRDIQAVRSYLVAAQGVNHELGNVDLRSQITLCHAARHLLEGDPVAAEQQLAEVEAVVAQTRVPLRFAETRSLQARALAARQRSEDPEATALHRKALQEAYGRAIARYRRASYPWLAQGLLSEARDHLRLGAQPKRTKAKPAAAPPETTHGQSPAVREAFRQMPNKATQDRYTEPSEERSRATG